MTLPRAASVKQIKVQARGGVETQIEKSGGPRRTLRDTREMHAYGMDVLTCTPTGKDRERGTPMRCMPTRRTSIKGLYVRL